MLVRRIPLRSSDRLVEAAALAQLVKVYGELERFIITRAAEEIRRLQSLERGAPRMTSAADHLKGFTDGLKADVATRVAKIKELKLRGPTSLTAFDAAAAELDKVYDAYDGATAEITAALADPELTGVNGGVKATIQADVGNSSAGSSTTTDAPAPGATQGQPQQQSQSLPVTPDTRASNFSALHPSARKQNAS